MKSIYLISPFIDQTIYALKIASLFFDEIKIEENILVQIKTLEKIDKNTTKGEVLGTHIFPDSNFLYAVSSLVDSGILKLINSPTRDSLYEEWDDITLNIKKLISERPDIIIKRQNDLSNNIINFNVPKEVLSVHNRYLCKVEPGSNFYPHFIFIYYASLLSDLFANTLAGNVPITASTIIEDFVKYAYNNEAFKKFKNELKNTDELLPYIAQDVLKIMVPDVSTLSFEQILELRFQLLEQVARFQEEIGKLTYTILNEKSYADENINLNEIVKYRIKPCIDDLEKKAKHSPLRIMKSFVQILKNPKSYVPFLGSVFDQISKQVAFFLSLGLVSTETALNYFHERKELSQNGLYYLIDLSKSIKKMKRLDEYPTFLKPVRISNYDQGTFIPYRSAKIIMNLKMELESRTRQNNNS